jgi:hypothetical protein
VGKGTDLQCSLKACTGVEFKLSTSGTRSIEEGSIVAFWPVSIHTIDLLYAYLYNIACVMWRIGRKREVEDVYG